MSEELQVIDSIPIHYNPYTDEVAYQVRPATPSEIAEAHPKCESCGRCEIVPRGHGLCRRGVCLTGYSLIDGPKVRPTTDYCPHHTELTGARDETE